MQYRLIGKEDLLALNGEAEGWYIPNLLLVGGTTIVYGAPGWGKSTICMEWALALPNRRPFAGHPEFEGTFVGERVGTAWLSFEDGWSEEVRGRLSQHDETLEWPLFVTEHTGETWTDALTLMLSATRGVGEQNIISREAAQHWADLCRQLRDNRVRVLFIDTLSELVDSEANPRLIQECFRLFSDMRREYGITVVLIGHASAHKDQRGMRKDELMGHTAWTAKARHTVLVDGNTTVTFARVTKSNRGPTGFNVKMAKVDGGPVKVLSVNTAAAYVEENQKSRQLRDWEKLRGYARTARDAGPEAWGSAKALGEACGKSQTVGRAIIDAGFFTNVSHGKYKPNDDRIDGVAGNRDAA